MIDNDKLNYDINQVKWSKFQFSDEVRFKKWRNVFAKLLTKWK
jgi:hypothetical protein